MYQTSQCKQNLICASVCHASKWILSPVSPAQRWNTLLFPLNTKWLGVFSQYNITNKAPTEMPLKWPFMLKILSMPKIWMCWSLCWSQCGRRSPGKPRRQQLFMRKTKRQESVNGSNPLWQTNTHQTENEKKTCKKDLQTLKPPYRKINWLLLRKWPDI